MSVSKRELVWVIVKNGRWFDFEVNQGHKVGELRVRRGLDAHFCGFLCVTTVSFLVDQTSDTCLSALKLLTEANGLGLS